MLCGGDDFRVIRETEVIVGTEIEHLAATGGGDVCVLRPGDDPLGLIETAFGDFGEGGGELGVEGGGHGGGVCSGSCGAGLPGVRRRYAGCNRRANDAKPI